MQPALNTTYSTSIVVLTNALTAFFRPIEGATSVREIVTLVKIPPTSAQLVVMVCICLGTTVLKSALTTRSKKQEEIEIYVSLAPHRAELAPKK